MKTETLIRVLEKSAEKHGGDTVLTIGHLLGILKFAKEIEDKAVSDEFKFLQNIEQELFNQDHY